MTSELRKLQPEFRISSEYVATLDLGKDKYYLAVGDGPANGGWSAQVYQDREDTTNVIARLSEPQGSNRIVNHYWLVNEEFFERVSEADDRGRAGDERYAGSDFRGIINAVESVQLLLNNRIFNHQKPTQSTAFN